MVTILLIWRQMSNAFIDFIYRAKHLMVHFFKIVLVLLVFLLVYFIFILEYTHFKSSWQL